VAAYDEAKVAALLLDSRIVRNGQKVRGTVTNARAFLEVQAEFGSFDAYAWRFVEGRSKQNTWRTLAEVPAQTAESDLFSRDLKRRGFTFVGSTIMYAFMQATGMINDHLIHCFRHAPLSGKLMP
jgi:DNA-3-methyladenine glycosylase I